MIESEFWAELRPELIKVAPGIHLTRIENAASSGVSDVTLAFKGREVWLELKMLRNGRMKFQPSQRQWIPKRVAAGANVKLLAREDDVHQSIYVFDAKILNATGDVRPHAIHRERLFHSWKKLLVVLLDG